MKKKEIDKQNSDLFEQVVLDIELVYESTNLGTTEEKLVVILISRILVLKRYEYYPKDLTQRQRAAFCKLVKKPITSRYTDKKLEHSLKDYALKLIKNINVCEKNGVSPINNWGQS